jgi:hypothetical protein
MAQHSELTMRTAFLSGVFALAASASAMAATPLVPAIPTTEESPLVLVDQGCGPGWWRGPWGHCRDTPFSGNLPGGGYGTNVGESYWGGNGNGCAAGWWRGPWGHCRDTPYHGRLPDGSWQ